jgi:hypothetical protein
MGFRDQWRLFWVPFSFPLPTLRTKAKFPGIKNTRRTWPRACRENTAVPMTFCDEHPPFARIRGTTPRMKKVVIKIGRKEAGRLQGGLLMPIPSSCLAFANSTIRMAFFAAS